MTEVLLFHHAQGLTPGVVAFADELRRAGHTVHTPDLFAGRTFATVQEGIAHAGEIGFDEVIERGVRAAEGLPTDIVYGGFSLGVLPAQRLAQTRPGARGALLFHACVPVSEFSPAWPDGVPVRIHAMEADPFFVDDGDIEAAKALVRSGADARLLLYPGDQHLFADSSLPSWSADAARLLTSRVIGFLDGEPEVDDHGRPEPPLAADETATILGFLDYQRATLAWKTAGLDHAGLCATVGASSMTLGGMLKHLTWIEEYWFTWRLAGARPLAPFDSVDWEADPGFDWRLTEDETVEKLHADWQAAVVRSRARVAEALADGGLAQLSRTPWPDGGSPSLRWVIVHMIEEYARHNGHADLIRESIDGGQIGE